MKPALYRLRSDARGATIVEFGLILLPMTVCLVGLLDLGYQMYVHSVLQGATNDVARAVTVENPNVAGVGTLDQRVQARIEGQMHALTGDAATYTVSSTSYYRYSDRGQPERLTRDNDRDGQYDAGDCWLDTNPNNVFDVSSGRSGIGGADDIVQFTVNMTMPRLVPIGGLVGLPNSYTMNVRSVIKRQPFADQQRPSERC